MFLKNLISLTVVFLVVVSIATDAPAALSTFPYLFTEQSASSTGQFEWDEFSPSGMTNMGPHAPDVVSTGVGTASLSAGDGGFVTSTLNLYSFGAAVDYSLNLSGLSDTESNTTVVLQFSATGAFDPNTILLDGTAPDSLVERGATEVNHSPAQSPFNTHYYWAEWQVPAETDYSLAFGHAAGHISFAQARVDYFNSASPYDAAAASLVPEPGTVGLALLGISNTLFLRRRRS